jgi:hypothetical protein
MWMAQQRPGWVWAYVGIGQMVDAVGGGQMFYDLTLGRARRDGDERAVETLLKDRAPALCGLAGQCRQEDRQDRLGELAVHERRHPCQRWHPAAEHGESCWFDRAQPPVDPASATTAIRRRLA